MRTVTLELLRHGPAHNQLLSPLTPYLALCENHAPVTINLPFEHNQFLNRLSALSYEFDGGAHADSQRNFQLQDTGRELGRILSSIPGLLAELNREVDPAGGIHLRLVLSASELALLPFELALAGNGLPGFGQPMLLQGQPPLCLTREVRRVTEKRLTWPTNARVLFVYASPRGFEVPVDAHAQALRKAVSAWVDWFAADDTEGRRACVDARLRLLPLATIQDIQEECATGNFTHVHILAHGVATQVGFDLRFGLALHPVDGGDEPDIVSGERLASALRPVAQPGREGLVRPMVVTLASCNGSNVGSVVGAGASVAHALQEAGIPLVIAGQFPISVDGSLQLVEKMYDGLLWGVDPRDLLIDLRRRLHANHAENHDWASLSAYASLPADFEEQLCTVQLARAKGALNTAMSHADKAIGEPTSQAGGPPDGTAGNTGGTADKAEFVRTNRKIGEVRAVMERLMDRAPSRRHEILGLLASASKRHAELHFANTLFEGRPMDLRQRKTEFALLRESRDLYWQAFKERSDMSWALVQFLSLDMLTLPPQQPGAGPRVPSEERRAEHDRLWTTAYTLSMIDLTSDSEKSVWAYDNLIELALLAAVMERQMPGGGQPAEESRYWLGELLRHVGPRDFQIYSTRRGLYRYGGWYAAVNPLFHVAVPLTQGLLDLLPDEWVNDVDDMLPGEWADDAGK